MNHYFITGSSRGLGKALAILLLDKEKNHVTGISRSQSISHKHYRHTTTNLSKPEEALAYRFEIENERPDKICLINNAGYIGDLKHIGDQDSQAILQGMNVNLVSPAILMNNFVAQTRQYDCPKIILNISSGAGRHVVESWDTYCATKAGINMYSRVAAHDLSVSDKNYHVFSVAPGVIDTEMMSAIRQPNEKDFGEVARFRELKKNGMLDSPHGAATKLLGFLENPGKYSEVIMDVREL